MGEDNQITLWVEDWGNYGDDSYPALFGKQGRNAPCGYIHTNGIWQTLGMEARNATYLDNARTVTDIKNISIDYKDGNATVAYSMVLTADATQELSLEYKFECTLYDVAENNDKLTRSDIKGIQKI